MTNSVCECRGYQVRTGFFQPNCFDWFANINTDIEGDLGCVTNWTEEQLKEIGKEVEVHGVYFCDRDHMICSGIISNELTNRGWGEEEFEVYNKLLETIREQEQDSHDEWLSHRQQLEEQAISRLASIDGVNDNLAKSMYKCGIQSLNALTDSSEEVLVATLESLGEVDNARNIKNAALAASELAMEERVARVEEEERVAELKRLNEREYFQYWSNLTGISFEELQQRERDGYGRFETPDTDDGDCSFEGLGSLFG